jgi:hypothetical protein
MILLNPSDNVLTVEFKAGLVFPAITAKSGADDSASSSAMASATSGECDW